MALPVDIAAAGFPQRFDVAGNVSVMLMHGCRDELCPVAEAVDFACDHGMPALLLDDGRQLAGQLPTPERPFALFPETLAA